MQDLNNINIEEAIEEFKNLYLGENFSFRDGQVDAVKNIINAFKNNKYVVLSAPTGSGKSIIALIVSYIFNKLKGMSYILTSEIMLQRQYDRDIRNFNLPFISLEGRDNYTCTENYEKVSQGDCMIYKNQKTWPCKIDCPYFSQKRKAIKANTCVLNYAYWLTQVDQFNFERKDDNNLFTKRELVVCDEAHFIMDILRNKYSICFDEKFIKNIEFVKTFLFDYNIKDITDLVNKIKMLHVANLYTNDKMSSYNILRNMLLEIDEVCYILKKIDTNVFEKYKNEKNELPSNMKKILRVKTYLETLLISLTDLIEISKINVNSLIKTQDGINITFNSLNENFISKNYFLSKSDYFLFMSASIINCNQFMENIGIDNAVFIEMKNPFTYEKSPIYYDNSLKINYQNINNSINDLSLKIEKILSNHQQERGVIHTGNYNLALQIYNKLSKENKKRIILYEGSQEKRDALNQLTKTKNNYFIIGPSLLTGVDLPGEYCKVIIVAKMPYLSLANNFNVEKAKLMPKWYQNKCIEDLLQGLGRGIRYPANPSKGVEEDHCITYIIDGTMDKLLKNNSMSFPKEFFKRLIHKKIV